MKIPALFNKTAVACVASGVALLAAPMVCIAGDAPLSHAAEPGVYKVLAENDEFRVVLATWKPGQRDTWHSHLSSAAYRITDCKSNVYLPDGSVERGELKAGAVSLRKSIASHSFENASDYDCQTLFVERK